MTRLLPAGKVVMRLNDGSRGGGEGQRVREWELSPQHIVRAGAHPLHHGEEVPFSELRRPVDWERRLQTMSRGP